MCVCARARAVENARAYPRGGLVGVGRFALKHLHGGDAQAPDVGLAVVRALDCRMASGQRIIVSLVHC